MTAENEAEEEEEAMRKVFDEKKILSKTFFVVEI